MNTPLTLGSLFDGSGSFPVAGLLSGIKPVWKSEIEPFPIAVTNKRLPQMKHYGDITTINGTEIEPVDIITFGSPCTDLSIAGKRAGLNAKRSRLFFQAVRVIKEMRCTTNGKYPRFIVWENVTGAFSSQSGEDFRTVLEEICKIKDNAISVPRPEKWSKTGEIMADGFSLAWRTLDAQYWGVPQRRKRIYLVADFDGERAGKILFESEGLSRYSAESFQTWQSTARNSAVCTGTAVPNLILCDQGGERIDVLNDVSATLMAESHHPPCILSVENHPADSRVKLSDDGKIQTLTSRCGTGGGNVPMVLENLKVYGICAKSSHSMLSDNPHSGFYQAETARTLDTSNQSPCKNQGGMVVIEGNGTRLSQHAIAFSQDAYDKYSENFQCGSLRASDGVYGGGSEAFVYSVSEPMYKVRRLTPQECALLQGMPSWWCNGLEIENPTEDDLKFWRDVFETHRKATNPDKKPKSDRQIIKWLTNPHSDSTEYKMWGNGIAIPCAWFVLAGITHFAN